MSEILEKLRQIILKSNISPEEQNDLLVLLPILPGPVIKVLVRLFEENPHLIQEFNENFKAKLRALSSPDAEAWEEIIGKEEEALGKEESEEEIE